MDRRPDVRRRIWSGCRAREKFVSTKIESRSLRAQHSIFVCIDGWPGIRLKRVVRHKREPRVDGRAARHDVIIANRAIREQRIRIDVVGGLRRA